MAGMAAYSACKAALTAADRALAQGAAPHRGRRARRPPTPHRDGARDAAARRRGPPVAAGPGAGGRGRGGPRRHRGGALGAGVGRLSLTCGQGSSGDRPLSGSWPAPSLLRYVAPDIGAYPNHPTPSSSGAGGGSHSPPPAPRRRGGRRGPASRWTPAPNCLLPRDDEVEAVPLRDRVEPPRLPPSRRTSLSSGHHPADPVAAALAGVLGAGVVADPGAVLEPDAAPGLGARPVEPARTAGCSRPQPVVTCSSRPRRWTVACVSRTTTSRPGAPRRRGGRPPPRRAGAASTAGRPRVAPPPPTARGRARRTTRPPWRERRAAPRAALGCGDERGRGERWVPSAAGGVRRRPGRRGRAARLADGPLGARCWTGSSTTRTAPPGTTVRCAPAGALDSLEVRLPVDGAPVRLAAAGGDVPAALATGRRWLGLLLDPAAGVAALRGDPVLGPLVRARPHVRVPGAADPFETAVGVVLGQHVSVAAGRRFAGRLVAAHGEGDGPEATGTGRRAARRPRRPGPPARRGGHRRPRGGRRRPRPGRRRRSRPRTYRRPRPAPPGP